MEYEIIIGLEIHVQLKTKSKMFCACSNDGENQYQNTTICPICLGHPGTLPVINKQAIEYGIKAGLAFGCEISEFTKFDRKNYFYPDLAKGYQISQFDLPIAKNGFLIIDAEAGQKKVRINRLHLEEDAAKNIHSQDEKNTLVDYNRGGTPLAEIVTEPDLRSAKQAKIFLQELRLIMRYLDVSSADMEKGHLRCDANVSLRPIGDHQLYPKTEIKNLNSFKAVERALEYEIQRQTKLWEKNTPEEKQSTRGWDEKKQETILQRVKEEASDYRYFPDPDLPPLTFEKSDIEKYKTEMIELPIQKRARFMDDYGLKLEDAKILTSSIKMADYTEQIISELEEWISSLPEMEGTEKEIWEKNKEKIIKLISSWLVNKLPDVMLTHGKTIETLEITPENFAEFLTLIFNNRMNNQSALIVLDKMVQTGIDPSHALEEEGLSQIMDENTLQNLADKIISENPKQVEQYKAGKEALFQFFIGQMMKESKGKASPEISAKILKEKISNPSATNGVSENKD